jgi:group I intron endonuclease
METKIGIYCIENIENKKKYIGSSKHVYKRRNRHFSELKNGKHKNIKLQSSYDKHGKDKFVFYIIELVIDEKLLISREQFYIDSLKPEYNINLTANSSLGVRRSKETKEKIRQANLGLEHPEWRNKIKSEAQCGENHWTTKKDFSDKSKKKMSDSQKELYKNGYKHPRKGLVESEEAINNKRIRVSKPILMCDLDGNMIREFKSAKEAHIEYGYSQNYIGKCCNNKIKKYKNYVWKFKK